jgi:hypothetical protein
MTPLLTVTAYKVGAVTPPLDGRFFLHSSIAVLGKGKDESNSFLPALTILTVLLVLVWYTLCEDEREERIEISEAGEEDGELRPWGDEGQARSYPSGGAGWPCLELLRGVTREARITFGLKWGQQEGQLSAPAGASS